MEKKTVRMEQMNLQPVQNVPAAQEHISVIIITVHLQLQYVMERMTVVMGQMNDSVISRVQT